MTDPSEPSIGSVAMAALRPSRLIKGSLHLTISALATLATMWLFTSSILGPAAIAYAHGGWLSNAPFRWWFVAVLAGLGAVALPAVLAGARLFAVIERARARALLDVKLVEPAPQQSIKSGLPRWIAHQLTDSAAWRALLYVALLAPLAVVAIGYIQLFAFNLLELIGDIWALGSSSIESDGSRPWWRIIPVLAIPFVVALLAQLNRVLVTGLLGPDTTERARVLEHSRDHAVGTAIGDLRRIERDLHDGVQARLVALTMELGRVRKQLESDPQAAGELLEHAQSDAKLALAELRDLARGIYPAVLTDRGLDPALSALAARMPIPVSVEVALPERLAASVETGAYFVIAELLTNVAKHSQATNVTVTVRGEGEGVVIEVTDDGHGGAVPTNTGGLAGLRERVAALEGGLTIDSPAGGPTRVTVEIPCRHHRSASS